jgi:hypothetical protein
MKPGELYKPVGFDCVLLCVAPETFTVEAGESPFLHSPLDGKIHFPTDETPPMHRAWHWSDLVTEDIAEKQLSDLIARLDVFAANPDKTILTLNNTYYLYENNF